MFAAAFAACRCYLLRLLYTDIRSHLSFAQLWRNFIVLVTRITLGSRPTPLWQHHHRETRSDHSYAGRHGHQSTSQHRCQHACSSLRTSCLLQLTKLFTKTVFFAQHSFGINRTRVCSSVLRGLSAQSVRTTDRLQPVRFSKFPSLALECSEPQQL